ncbi:MAG TPA: nuclear transport factor 2 family protein [Sphingobium sp.]|nr:nuclear transport factor 2 family protein [Sphingobium sp.]
MSELSQPSLPAPDQDRMRQALQAYVDRINAGDRDGVLALFAPDAVIEDPLGSPPKKGAEIETWFSDTIAFGTHIRPVAPIRGSHANAAALVFEVTFQPPEGPRLLIRSLDVCTFDAEGRIISLIAYWGPDDVEPAL